MLLLLVGQTHKKLMGFRVLAEPLGKFQIDPLAPHLELTATFDRLAPWFDGTA